MGGWTHFKVGVAQKPNLYFVFLVSPSPKINVCSKYTQSNEIQPLDVINTTTFNEKKIPLLLFYTPYTITHTFLYNIHPYLLCHILFSAIAFRRLKIRRATPNDSGNYSCVPTIAKPTSVYVHVIIGK